MSIYSCKHSPSFYKDFPNTPYTYLIGWSKHDKYYYGVKYAKNCHPTQLFDVELPKTKRYCTSSSVVENFIAENGLPDIIQIRRIFKDALSAKLWEDKVLNSLMRNENHKLLNISNMNNFHGRMGGKPKGSKEKLSTRLKKSETQKNYVSIRNIITSQNFRMLKTLAEPLLASGEYVHLGTFYNKGRSHTEESKSNFRKAAQNREVFHCKLCDRNIKGKHNWNRHNESLGHITNAEMVYDS